MKISLTSFFALRFKATAMFLMLFAGCDGMELPDTGLTGSGNEEQQATTPIDVDQPASLPALPALSPEQIIAGLLGKESYSITDADLASLAGLESGLEQITELDLTSASISGAGLQSLAAFPALRSLNLKATRLTDGQWEYLGQLESLESVNLTRTGVGNAVLSEVAKLKNLQHLDLSETFVSDDTGTTGAEAFAQLKSLSQLEELNLSAPDITGSCLEFLGSQGARAPLRSLTATNSNFGYQGFVHLKEFPGLEELHCSNAQVTDGSMEGLRGLRNLRVVSLSGNLVSDKGLANLVQCTDIEQLSLQQNPGITDAGLQKLVRLKKLTKLNLQGTSCSVAGVMAFKKKVDSCVVEFQQQQF